MKAGLHVRELATYAILVRKPKEKVSKMDLRSLMSTLMTKLAAFSSELVDGMDIGTRRLVKNITGSLGAFCLLAVFVGVLLRVTSSTTEESPDSELLTDVEVETVLPFEETSLSTHEKKEAQLIPRSEIAIASEFKKVLEASTDKSALSYYPLQVGRYWRYRHQDKTQGSFLRTQVIQRRENRNSQELFFFSDGTVVYEKEGFVYEIGSGGGINVIPLGSSRLKPYIYQSQGMKIEKHIGAVDTNIVLGSFRYKNCLEVVTKFRPIEYSEEGVVSYSSFYSRGIGLVGRRPLSKNDEGTLSVILKDYGIRKL